MKNVRNVSSSIWIKNFGVICWEWIKQGNTGTDVNSMRNS